MKNIKNLSLLDRAIRIILAEILFILWFFWTGWVIQIIIFIFTFIFFTTWTIWICLLYKPFWINTLNNEKSLSKIFKILFTIFSILLFVLWSYYSIFFTKKIFLEDYNKMNNYYKQVLFNSWKENREESVKNYDLLVLNYKMFSDKYLTYKPYILKFDKKINSDFESILLIISNQKNWIYNWDLKNTHLELEKIRPIFQNILKRNNFSILAVSLVDFHDVMEKVIDAANKKDISSLNSAYIEADEKLKAVEIEANDKEIIAIRKSLEEIKSLALKWELDKLWDKAQELKSNFVKVYLKRG